MWLTPTWKRCGSGSAVGTIACHWPLLLLSFRPITTPLLAPVNALLSALVVAQAFCLVDLVRIRRVAARCLWLALTARRQPFLPIAGAPWAQNASWLSCSGLPCFHVLAVFPCAVSRSSCGMARD